MGLSAAVRGFPCYYTSCFRTGVCVNVFGDGSWSLSGAGAGQSGQTKNDPTKAFVKLGLSATGTDVTVTVDGVAQPTATIHVGAPGLDVKVPQLSCPISAILTV